MSSVALSEYLHARSSRIRLRNTRSSSEEIPAKLRKWSPTVRIHTTFPVFTGFHSRFCYYRNTGGCCLIIASCAVRVAQWKCARPSSTSLTHLLGFDSLTQRLMWVDFVVGSRLAPGVFLRALRFSSLHFTSIWTSNV